MDKSKYLKTSESEHVHLRPIQPKDCGVLTELLHDLAHVTGFTGSVVLAPSNLKAAAFSESPLVYGMLAENRERVLGFCLFHPLYSSWQGEPGVYILDLHVIKEARIRGLGRNLLESAAKKAFDFWGASFMKLDVASDNTEALAFYHRLGLKPDKPGTAMVAAAREFKILMRRNPSELQPGIAENK